MEAGIAGNAQEKSCVFLFKRRISHDIHTHGSGGFRNWLAISQIPGKFHEKVVDSLQ
jgi:hypothetical protein